jgi:flagellar basal body-associated protein FliL
MKRSLKIGIIAVLVVLTGVAGVLSVRHLKSKKTAAPAPASQIKVIDRARADLSKCQAENLEIREDGSIVLKDCVVLFPENDQ